MLRINHKKVGRASYQFAAPFRLAVARIKISKIGRTLYQKKTPNFGAAEIEKSIVIYNTFLIPRLGMSRLPSFSPKSVVFWALQRDVYQM